MMIRKSVIFAARSLPVFGLAALAATPAFAQFASLSGGLNPVQVLTNIWTLLLTAAAVICGIAFVIAGLACFTGRLAMGWFIGAGTGTLIIACAAYISTFIGT